MDPSKEFRLNLHHVFDLCPHLHRWHRPHDRVCRRPSARRGRTQSGSSAGTGSPADWRGWSEHVTWVTHTCTHALKRAHTDASNRTHIQSYDTIMLSHSLLTADSQICIPQHARTHTHAHMYTKHHHKY